ncbi:MAG: DUF3329 domain-containing protein [Pseudomonadota bacterium]
MKFFDFSNPFYRPLGVRVGIVVVCAVWGFIELTRGQPYWALFFGAIAVFCAWKFATLDYGLGDED